MCAVTPFTSRAPEQEQFSRRRLIKSSAIALYMTCSCLRGVRTGAGMEWRTESVKNRRTVEFEVGGRRYFIKIHRGVGWREIIKNVTYGRAPIMSAENEWRAIDQLRHLGISTLTLAGIGKRGSPPAWLESFVITEALDGMISLEDLTREWHGVHGAQRVRLKRALIKRL